MQAIRKIADAKQFMNVLSLPKSFAKQRIEIIIMPLDTAPHKKIANSGYPDGFFNLFGSITDETFDIPGEIAWEHEARRELI
ncbi:MAG: hypothetical protein LBM77_07050 [Spirochaetaceae bacterium]|jgi:hypothetical protein|nr:hypothetical protein [Spirochaetaceae bacterium]